MFSDDSDEFNFILKMSITNTTSRICHALKRKSQEIYARLRFHSFMNISSYFSLPEPNCMKLNAMLITTIHKSSLNFSCVTFTILAFYATLQIGKLLEILVSVL